MLGFDHESDIQASGKMLSNIAQRYVSTAATVGAKASALLELTFDNVGPGAEATGRVRVFDSSLETDFQFHLVDDRIEQLAGLLRETAAQLNPLIWNESHSKWERIDYSDLGLATSHGSADNATVALALFVGKAPASLTGFIVCGDNDLLLEDHLTKFHSLGLRLIEAVQSMEGPKLAQRLSSNERACLVWSACGKTSGEISKILGLSEHTVNHYFTLAASKLDANNRPHTIAKAIRGGHIRFEEII